ncbi:unnamed protein product [Periconia digitata]|uniref:Uncharacterized protein n=1 Tax=Periconia digitata TaxID=1303443 RepID=A0A9W4U369_9PLEO|nr:unnamed protein product [Periconia digitata]
MAIAPTVLFSGSTRAASYDCIASTDSMGSANNSDYDQFVTAAVSTHIQDSTIYVDVTPLDASTEQLLSLPKGVNTTTGRFNLIFSWYNIGDDAEFRYGDWEVSASVALDAGVTATFGMRSQMGSIVLGSRDSEDLPSLVGPASSIVGTFPRNATLAKTYCSGLTSKFFRPQYTAVQGWVEFSRSGNASADARGLFGLQGKGISMKSKLTAVKEGCSMAMIRCVPDHDGFEVCLQDFSE